MFPGFLLPFHFGVVSAFKDHNIKFDQAVGTSGGVMAALAMLGGADLEVKPSLLQNLQRQISSSGPLAGHLTCPPPIDRSWESGSVST